jgi:hypothetical protein
MGRGKGEPGPQVQVLAGVHVACGLLMDPNKINEYFRPQKAASVWLKYRALFFRDGKGIGNTPGWHLRSVRLACCQTGPRTPHRRH